jgi:hypothetical protein
MVKGGCKAQSLTDARGNSMLQVTEKAPCAWEGQGHRSKFAQELMPFVKGEALAVMGDGR